MSRALEPSSRPARFRPSAPSGCGVTPRSRPNIAAGRAVQGTVPWEVLERKD
jgi:hypothetical protein